MLGPDGANWVQGDPEIIDGTVTATLRPLQLAGGYSIAYRIVSADGHPVTDELTFTINEGASGLVAAPADAPTSTSADGELSTADAAGVGRAGGADGGSTWLVVIPGRLWSGRESSLLPGARVAARRTASTADQSTDVST